MISGTIIGEIMIAIMARRKGMCGWLRPMAASVPKETDNKVATGAIWNEFFSELCQSELVKKST